MMESFENINGANNSPMRWPQEQRRGMQNNVPQQEPAPPGPLRKKSGPSGGGRTKGPRPLPQGNTRPKPFPASHKREGGPPAPSKLSTVASTPRNDPLHLEALMPEPGHESRPIAEEVSVYPGFFALSSMAKETHHVVSAIDASISRKVPESVFAYYAACLSYARMIKVLKTSSRRVTSDEEGFMDLVYDAEFKPPNSISHYLKGFGNSKLPNGREVRFRARPRKNVSSEDGSIGWFGRVDENTHYLYSAYPCLAVYIKRIQADLNYTEGLIDPDWDLPEDISPNIEGAGLPTSNLLGYAPAVKLLPQQVQWLRNAGFTANFECESEHPTIPFVASLLNAVQTEIDYARVNTGDVVSTSSGSLSQTVVTVVAPGAVSSKPECDSLTLCKHTFDMPGSLVVADKAYRYLHEHVIDDQFNSWSIYDWNGFRDVPVQWRNTANHLFDGCSSVLKQYCYRTVSHSPKVEVRKIVKVLVPDE